MNNMMNQAILVGRVVEYTDQDVIVLDVRRNFKNSDGTYGNDRLTIQDRHGYAKSAPQYLNVDYIVACKCRLEFVRDEMNLILEKISFISGE
jgi:hypothetical protein